MPSPPPWPDPAVLEIEPAALALLQHHAATFRLIDCREPEEWDINRLPNAELLPLSTFSTDFREVLPDPAQPIVIHCHHGMRSAKGALFLRHHGYARVWSLARGIEGWSLEVDPSVPRY